MLVQNNLISNVGTGVVAGAIGVHCPTLPELEPGGFGGFYAIVNNSIVMEEGTGVRFDFDPSTCNTSCGLTAFNEARGQTVELYNNIIQCDAGGTTACDDTLGACISSGGALASNNNNLVGPVIGVLNGTLHCSLGAWRSAVFADKDSISVAPAYADAEYRLPELSECVNRGEWRGLLSRSLHATDYFAGAAGERVRAGEVDIGMDEVDQPELGAPFIHGDANEDGIVNYSDGSFIRNYFAGGPAPICREAMDVNDDETIDISDPTFLFNFLSGPDSGIPQWIPPPYPQCGVDPYGIEEVCSQASPACGP